MLYLDAEAPGVPIEMYINSGGGKVLPSVLISQIRMIYRTRLQSSLSAPFPLQTKASAKHAFALLGVTACVCRVVAALVSINPSTYQPT